MKNTIEKQSPYGIDTKTTELPFILFIATTNLGSLYKRYVDDTLAKMPSGDAASEFLNTLNGLPSQHEIYNGTPVSGRIPLLALNHQVWD